MKRNRIIAALTSGVLVLGAAGAVSAQSPSAMPAMSMAPASTVPGSSDVLSPAADLRTTLDLKLGEHIILAVKATGAALRGDTEQFQAYGGLLNTNGTDIGAMIGSVYGTDAQDAFNTIWSAHNGFFVDYTTGVATDNKQLRNRAVKNLTEQYVPQFSELIATATGLPLDAVTGLVTDHVLQTKAVVDAQASKRWDVAYEAIRAAYAHMQMIGDALAGAIVAQNPETLTGSVDASGVSFRVALNQLLQEHLYLATLATDAALAGRNKEFAPAGAALNTSGTDVGGAIGSLYGQEAQDAFNTIWSAHNGFFVDYTTGVATKDQARMDKAVEDLTTGRWSPRLVPLGSIRSRREGQRGCVTAGSIRSCTHSTVTVKNVDEGDPSSSMTMYSASYVPGASYVWTTYAEPLPFRSVTSPSLLAPSPQYTTTRCVSFLPGSVKSKVPYSGSPTAMVVDGTNSGDGATLRTVTRAGALSGAPSSAVTVCVTSTTPSSTPVNRGRLTVESSRRPPGAQRWPRMEPSGSFEALPSRRTVEPSSTSYGPPASARGGLFGVGVGVGVGRGVGVGVGVRRGVGSKCVICGFPVR